MLRSLPWQTLPLVLSVLFATALPALAISIGNLVWEDLDEDGVQETGEPGIPGVSVQLWNSAKTQLLDTTTTDRNGNYTLDAPGPGNYRVRVLRRYSQDRFTLKDVGSDTADSDINPSGTDFGFTDAFNLASNVISISSKDAGMISDPMRDHTIGDRTFRSGSGLQNISNGLSGVTVELLNSAGTVLQTTVSGSNGFYSFLAAPGTYRLRFTAPGPYIPSQRNAGSDDTIDSDIDESGLTDLFTLGAGQVLRDLDAGFNIPANVGNFVWDDRDGDGRQDVGEPGLEGVTVQIWNGARTQLLRSTVTDANGNYSMSVPVPGDYRVRVLLPYPGDRFTVKDSVTDNDLLDSDVNPSGAFAGFTDIYSLASNLISIVSIDIGIIADPMKDHNIGDRVFRADENGLQGASGIGGVEVDLLNPAGLVLQTTTSLSGSGHYSFKAVPGTYRLRFRNVGSQIPTPHPFAGIDPELDSDIDADGLTPLFTLAAGQVRRDLDAGFVYPINVGNLVWRDLNGDGIQDPGEPGLANVDVELWDEAKSVRLDATRSSSTGQYNLVAPGPGTYRLFALRPKITDAFSPRMAGDSELLDSDIYTTTENYGFSGPMFFAPNLISTTSRDIGIITASTTGVIPLKILSITRNSATQCTLVFTGPSGGTYHIERSADLRTWIVAVPSFVSSTASVTRAVTVPAGQAKHFFRVWRTK